MKVGASWWLVYSGCLPFRSRAYRTCCSSTNWKMTSGMPPGPSTELDTFGGLVMSSLIEKMWAPGKDTGCPLGFASIKGHFLKTLKKHGIPPPTPRTPYVKYRRKVQICRWTHLLYFLMTSNRFKYKTWNCIAKIAFFFQFFSSL